MGKTDLTTEAQRQRGQEGSGFKAGGIACEMEISRQVMRHCTRIRLMVGVFNALSFALLAAAIIMFILVVRDVWSHLPDQDRMVFQGRRRFRAIGDRALSRAWGFHIELYPNSRKRQLFALLLVAAALSLMGYPLWSAFR